MILTNGKIWTGDPRRPWAEAVAIEGSRIAAVGRNAEIDTPAARGSERIDLGGRLAVPGFIDNHTHFIEGGFEMARARLRDAATPEEFARRIGEQAKRTAAGRWITGGSWDETRWDPSHLPTRAQIDSVTAEHPVFVSRLDTHMALANSRALALAGITRHTPDPPGGTIVRDAQGEPTGILKDAAQPLVQRVIPRASIEERMAAARAGLLEAARLGVTAFGDMSSPDDAFDDLHAWQRLDETGGLTARVHLFAPLLECERAQPFATERLRLGGVKGFADGSLGSSTAAFFEPLDDDRDNRGLMMAAMGDGRMRRAVEAANRRGLPIALHAIGDRAVDEVLTIFERLPPRRFRVEHAQHLSPALIARMARLGVIASMQPCHAVDDGRWAEARIGHERARWSWPFRSLLDAGVLVTFGSDWTVAPLDPILGIDAAVNLRGWFPEQTIAVEEALRCYTVNNAYALFRENEIGRIAPGMFADIAVLSEDLFAIPARRIAEVQVGMTIFDGTILR